MGHCLLPMGPLLRYVDPDLGFAKLPVACEGLFDPLAHRRGRLEFGAGMRLQTLIWLRSTMG